MIKKQGLKIAIIGAMCVILTGCGASSQVEGTSVQVDSQLESGVVATQEDSKAETDTSLVEKAPEELEGALLEAQNAEPEEEYDEYNRLWLSDTTYKYRFGDVDGNGTIEYMLVEQEYSNDYYQHMQLWWNGEAIYEFDDILPANMGDIEYIDLDGDGANEVFFTFYPHVNSMPLMEYRVVKEENGTWKELEMFRGETELENAFPIHVTYVGNHQVSITCDGVDDEVLYDFYDHYQREIDMAKAAGDEYNEKWNERLQKAEDYKVGDAFGGTSAWGVWDIHSVSKDGETFLIAEHGIEGPGGKWDGFGTVNIWFHYDLEGKIAIQKIEVILRPEDTSLVAVFDTTLEKIELPKIESKQLTYDSFLGAFEYDFMLDCAGYYWYNTDYVEPLHGEFAPFAWYALGGVGVCMNPNVGEKAVYENGHLVEYAYLDNHMSHEKIQDFTFTSGSGVLYKYNVDLYTATEFYEAGLSMEDDSTQDYWVAYFSLAEGQPIYMEYFNCDYFTEEQAVEYVKNSRIVAR